jgi:Putative transposase of IS4/5 family (DUF4096)
MATQLYATDLTDAEWDLIEPLLPPPAHPGRPGRHSWRPLLNAIFYQRRTGGAWRFLPQEWPPPGMAALEHGVSVLSPLPGEWDVGARPHHPARAAAGPAGP